MSMQLSEVWGYFDEDVKRVFTALGRETDYVRTKLLLGALSDGPDGEVAEVLRLIEEETGVDLIHPESIPKQPGDCPGGLTFTPCVQEVLNFFRIHQLRPVTVGQLALRLIQIGTGSTIRTLEENGYLEEIRGRLEDVVNLE